MKPILLFYGYFTFKDGKPFRKYCFETLTELRCALFSRYKECDLDLLYKRVTPFRAYGRYVKVGTREKVLKLYDRISKAMLISHDIQD